MTAASALTAYPNPTNGLVTINFNAVAAERYTVKVVDLLGNVVVSDQLNAVEGNNMKELNLTNVAKGMYLMSLETEGGNVQTPAPHRRVIGLSDQSIKGRLDWGDPFRFSS